PAIDVDLQGHRNVSPPGGIQRHLDLHMTRWDDLVAGVDREDEASLRREDGVLGVPTLHGVLEGLRAERLVPGEHGKGVRWGLDDDLPLREPGLAHPEP